MQIVVQSLPARGGWIEIWQAARVRRSAASLPARGGWIEIGPIHKVSDQAGRPSPHGEGGLKSAGPLFVAEKAAVPPRTGRVD